MTAHPLHFKNSHRLAGMTAAEIREAGDTVARKADFKDLCDRLAAVKPDPDLVEMNSKFAVVRVSGKTRVMSFEESPAHRRAMVPVYSTIGDFKAFHAKRRKVVTRETEKDERTERVGIGKWWIDHEDRRQYDGVVYEPGASAKATSGKLNLWQGFGVTPRKGDCSLYLTHLRDNICGRNAEHAEYLLNWMAYGVQNPGSRAEVAVVLRGKEGTGKGVAVKHYGQLFGAHYVHVSQASHLTGHFNAHLQQCSVLFADEAFFAGDRSHEGILKALITEDTLMIEPKGLDSFPVRNNLHVLMSSNSDWVIPAGADARRFFVLTVADDHKQDTDYFGALSRQMENGGREALLYHLLDQDLSEFNIRAVPQTEALADQKAHSRRGIDRLVEIIANDGELPVRHGSHADVTITSGEDRGEGFYTKARVLAPDLKHLSSVVIATSLSKDWGCKPWKDNHQRGIRFPALTELRQLFDKKHGPQPWPTYAVGDQPATHATGIPTWT